MQWPVIDQRLVEQTAYRREIKDNGYKSVFTNSWLVCQRNRSWMDKGIRQKSTKRVNSFIAWSAFCLGPPNCDPMDSEKRLRVYKSSATMARHAPAKKHTNQNAHLDALRSAEPKKLRVYMASDANWLNNHCINFINAFWLKIYTNCAICWRSSSCGRQVLTFG